MFKYKSSYSHHIHNYEDEYGNSFTLEWYTDRSEDIILTNVFVKECNRRKGFGNEILKTSEDWAKSDGFKQLFLKVAKGTWQNDWYNRHGFNFHEIDEYDGSFIWLVKQIND